MGYFDGKTQAEIAALPDAEIERIINLECARRGVQLFLPVPVQPTLEAKPDTKVFEASGVYVTSREDAEKLVECINSLGSRVKLGYTDWSYSTRHIEGTQAGEETVTVFPAYSQAAYLSRAAELKTFAEKKKQYDADKKAYDEMMRGRREVENEVGEELHAARSAISRINTLKELYEKYLGMASGDRKIAWNFLRDAYRLTAEDAAAIGCADVSESPSSIADPSAELVASAPA